MLQFLAESGWTTDGPANIGHYSYFIGRVPDADCEGTKNPRRTAPVVPRVVSGESHWHGARMCRTLANDIFSDRAQKRACHATVPVTTHDYEIRTAITDCDVPF